MGKLRALSFALLAIVALAVDAKPAYWRCATSSGAVDFFLIDLAARTFDHAAMQITRDAPTPGNIRINAQGTGNDHEPMLFSLSLPSGALVGEGRAGASIHAQCAIPDDASQEVAEITGSSPKTETSAPTPAARVALTPSVAPDNRFAELQRARTEIDERVGAGKLKHQEAARLSRQKYLGIFPEQAGNPLVNEWFAYLEVIGEKIDHKKLTVAEGQYELARKASEIQERQARMEAEFATSQAAAKHKASQEAVARSAAEESAKSQAANAAAVQQAKEIAEKRLAVEQELLAQQRLQYAEAQQRIAEKQRLENLKAFLRLLAPPRSTSCTGVWMGNVWTSNCYSPR